MKVQRGHRAVISLSLCVKNNKMGRTTPPTQAETGELVSRKRKSPSAPRNTNTNTVDDDVQPSPNNRRNKLTHGCTDAFVPMLLLRSEQAG